MLMLMQCKSNYASLTPRVLQQPLIRLIGCVLGIIPQLGRNRFESLSLSDSENLTEQRQRRHLIELDDYNDDDDVTTLYRLWLLLPNTK